MPLQLEELFDLLRIESISSDGKHAAELRQAADWVATARDEAVTHAMVVPTMLGRILDELEAIRDWEIAVVERGCADVYVDIAGAKRRKWGGLEGEVVEAEGVEAERGGHGHLDEAGDPAEFNCLHFALQSVRFVVRVFQS